MTGNKLLREYKDDEFKKQVCKPLEDLLTAVSKYNTLPLCIIQFLISRTNLHPETVLISFADKDVMGLISKINYDLNQSVSDSSPDLITPTILIFPPAIQLKDAVYNVSQQYYYSSAYLVNVSSFKKSIKDGLVKSLSIYSNSSERDCVSCTLECIGNTGCIKLPELKNLPIKIPFINSIRFSPRYKDIINEIVKENRRTYSDKEELEKIFNRVKSEQSFDYNGVHLFRDFIKQKPLSLSVYSCENKENDIDIKTVCLETAFNNGLNHLLFYRYINNVVDTIIASIEDL
jgi:hypothetical protein